MGRRKKPFFNRFFLGAGFCNNYYFNVFNDTNKMPHNIDIIKAAAGLLLCLTIVALIFVAKRSLAKNMPSYLQLIPLYFLLIIIQLIFAEYWIFSGRVRTEKGPINISAYGFTIIEFLILSTLLSKFVKNIAVKKVVLFSCFLFPATGIIMWYTEDFVDALSVLTTIESLLLISFCLCYFFELLNGPATTALSNDPSFWITTGILFFFISITPYYLAFGYFRKIREMQLIDYFGYMLIIVFLSKSTFTKQAE
jgi:hypothetical protein